MASLTLKDLYKSYGNTEVLHGISGEIQDGEFVVIVGPSGCGKSTLLRMIAGLEIISAGEVYIGDRKVNDLEPADRDIAMVFQNYALYPHMSVRQNMAYGLKIRGISKKEINRRVEEAADILEIREYLDRKPRQLSGGQRQRVAMGRAIVREPEVFLFDEPLSNLDAKLRVQMRLEIRKLQQRLGVTAVYVTHDQVEAMTLGDRLMVLNAGYVEQFGTPLELYERPASLFVAGFIGSPAMNFLEAKGQPDGMLQLENGVVISGAKSEGPVTLGMRPEHLIEDTEGPIRIEVSVLEQLGANTLIHGTLEGTEREMVASLPGIHQLEPGRVLGFLIRPDELHQFDSKTGKRL